MQAIEYCNIFVALTQCNYIIFKKIEIFRKIKIQRPKSCEGIFKNILFVEMKIFNLINYLIDMCESCQGTMIYNFA